MRLNFYENHNPKPDPPRSFNHSDLSAWSCLMTSQSVIYTAAILAALLLTMLSNYCVINLVVAVVVGV